MKAVKRSQESSCFVSPGNALPEQLKVFLTLSMFVNDLNSINFRVPNKFQDQFANKETMNKDN